MVLRLPFRFGIATLERCPQAFVRARIVFPDGRSCVGCAAELLIPKWFDKDPGKTDARNMEDLRRMLAAASDAYTSDPAYRSAFGLSAFHHQPLIDHGARLQCNSLTACYGPAVVDRAILDALCRHLGVSIFSAVRANLPGIEAGALTPDLENFALDSFLAGLQPRAAVAARHTVGLLDPIVPADIKLRVDDGLPRRSAMPSQPMAIVTSR